VRGGYGAQVLREAPATLAGGGQDSREDAGRLGDGGGPWGLQVSVVEAMEQAAAMADRFNQLSLRSLRDLRRYSPLVVVQGSAQVNVAERQVNVTQAGGSRNELD
jgi:hypothetical protein